MIFDQSEFDIRCEWGSRGASILAPISDVVVVVDVLSFSTAVDVATARETIVYPYLWRDDGVYDFAASIGAEVVDKKNENGYRLSPASLMRLPPGMRIVLPSPNGSQISLDTGATATIAGCIRNCRAVAESAARKGAKISIIPAGERWADGTLRPSFEDWIGAGAIISLLDGSRSPEAQAAASAFENAKANLLELIKLCGSGKEKIARGEEADLSIAADLNASNCVPVLIDGCYVREAPAV